MAFIPKSHLVGQNLQIYVYAKTYEFIKNLVKPSPLIMKLVRKLHEKLVDRPVQ